MDFRKDPTQSLSIVNGIFLSTHCKTQGLKKNPFAIFEFFSSVFLDLFVLNASGLSHSYVWPGAYSVAKADFELTVISPTSVC